MERIAIIGNRSTEFYYTSPRLSTSEANRLRPQTQTVDTSDTLFLSSTPNNVPLDFLRTCGQRPPTHYCGQSQELSTVKTKRKRKNKSWGNKKKRKHGNQ